MISRLKIICIICFVLITIAFVYIYNSFVKYYHYDILNTNITRINICGWNLLHIVAYFMLCVYISPQTKYDYILLILSSFIWMLVEHLANKLMMKHTEEICNEANTCYCNPYLYKFDDIIFNLAGIMLYLILYKN